MLTSLTLRDFKSFGDATIPFAPLTLLVGANASGKSNVLDALRVLEGLSISLRAGEILDGKSGVWPGIRGGSKEAARVGHDRFTLASSWRLRVAPPHLDKLPPGDGPPDFRYEVEIICDSSPHVRNESWHCPRNADLDLLPPRGALLADALGVGGSAAQGRALTGWTLRRAGQSPRLFDPNPDSLRGYHAMALSSVGVRGEGLVPALFRLLQADPGREQDLVDWISELCSPKVIDIDFVEVKETRDVGLVLVEHGERRIPARSASDGTLRFIALLAAIWLAEPDSVLFIEEPDLGLHPARLGLLAEFLESRSGEVQVIATTHSPQLLAYLSDDALGNVVALGRDEASGDTRVARLRDLEHFATLAASRDVAHLFATGWVERAL